MAAAAAAGPALVPVFPGTDFSTCSVRDLKSLLDHHSISYEGCVERFELEELCKAIPVLAEPQPEVKATEAGVHHAIEQNTPEWFKMRRGPWGARVGASETGVITGVDTNTAYPLDLYKKIVLQDLGEWEYDEEQPAPCVHGHRCEPLIADAFALEMAEKLEEGGYYEHAGWMGALYGASPDRRIISQGREGEPPAGEVKALLEIKAPWGQMYTTIKPGHMAQMQYQMRCAGVKLCYYVAMKLDRNEPEKTIPSKTQVMCVLVHYSEEYWQWMQPRLWYFSKCLIDRTPPPIDLYKNEAMGLAPAPVVKTEKILVTTGAWRVRPEA